MKLSKRILAEYNLETQPNYWNEEVFKNYNYVGWHDQRLYEEYDHDRFGTNPYSLFNSLENTNTADNSLLSQRMKNREIVIDDFEELL